MTTTRWTTTVDVPPAQWAAMTADIRTLLGLLQLSGATLTDPSGKTGPVMGAERIAFTVTLPDRGPLTVQFTRAAGDGEVETSSPVTDGLVLTAMNRAAQHWGMLLAWSSDAGTTARALAATVVEGLFGAQDRAVVGGAAPSVEQMVADAAARAQDAVAAAETGPDELDYAGRLGAVIAELGAQRAGVLAALSLLPKPEPEPEPEPPVTPPTSDVPDPDEQGGFPVLEEDGGTTKE